MNIENLVKSAVLSLTMAACGSSDPAREICEQFVSCCHQVPDWTTQKVCLLRAGGNVDATVRDCMYHVEATYSPDVLSCIAGTFRCDPDPLGYGWSGSCNADVAAL